ncbi:MAG: arginine--tRNA ligase [Chloroflexi bacterium]|nr:arginine--tRNA ligase [Chloroflexota bacterium]
MNGILKLKNEIIASITKAFEYAYEKDMLPQVSLPQITVERPKDSKNGEYACSVALKVASSMNMRPMQVAEAIAQNIDYSHSFECMVAPPGFLNFTVRDNWLQQSVDSTLVAGDNYGKLDKYRNQNVQIEFVSANPTGPIHVGHGRGAVLGSALGNVLSQVGYNVLREFYINDAGNQIASFKDSLYVRYMQVLEQAEFTMPQDGYMGKYIIELAQEIQEQSGDVFKNDADGLAQMGLLKMLADIKTDLGVLDVQFDSWFSEKSLFDTGEYQVALDKLNTKGYLLKRDNALWFASSELGEEKDNVIVRSDGTPTYFATDIAYHHNKFLQRNFDRVIDIWGADHQGHVSRMKSVLQALDIDPDRLTVLIAQMVTIKRGNELVKISKRGGTLVTLREVINEVGRDAVRFAFMSRSADSQMDFDLELAKKESAENPVYYVQYAYARIASILRKAEEAKISYEKAEVSLLKHEAELALIKKILMLPEKIEQAADELTPHYLSYYASDLATMFHAFYKECRVLGNKDKKLDQARLKLCACAKLALWRTLAIMGISSPEKM